MLLHLVRGKWLSIIALTLIFLWIYGRFAGQLAFVLDDYIETQVSLAKPLPAVIADSFTGRLSWSGYRPVSYSTRALLAHWFGLANVSGYHLFGLGLHFCNTLLVLTLARRLLQDNAWATVAALIFLLLPAHNEAVLYFSANANLIALCFGLLTLLLATHHLIPLSPCYLVTIGAWLAYTLAVLAYEVMLALPFLLFWWDWQNDWRGWHKRLGLYAGLAAVVLLMLGLRLWAMEGRLTPARADYGIRTDWAHLLQGFRIFWGEIFLLHTSPWPHLPLYANVRDWMAPLNPRALASVLLTVGLTASIFAVTDQLPSGKLQASWKVTKRLSVALWGLLWLLLFSLPFVILAGRLPENRYVYIPSVGFALMLAGVGSAWCGAGATPSVNRALPRALHSWRQVAPTGLMLALLGYYAYVDTSDVAEWERAGNHVRAFLAGVQRTLPAAPPEGEMLFQVGVPGDIGTAYLFTTPEAFQAAMQLTYADAALQAEMGDLQLRARLAENPAEAKNIHLAAYDRQRQSVARVLQATLCNPVFQCTDYTMAPAAPRTPLVRYVQIFDENRPDQQGLALLFAAAEGDPALQMQSCWPFYDTRAAQVDPATFDNAPVLAACERAATRFEEAGQLP